ncbi:MAG: AtpZ/AtpI family protein [Thiohalocapsa sp.]|jgi:ATP synthase protein I|uniref:AtpZ/AtpI family protein n=1 Tax=Thiohalocapsa sp. TaxID=2497641 RepID=UPI0025EADA10|nr:AtpZ/AtpI family protein [Thiohalocapsa sp.]MCG6942657.1 AtpZ/AtpI family protein [Thiohalocapsa sp.]
MTPTRDDEHLERSVERDAERIRKARAEREHLLVQTIYLTTLGLVFVLPVVAGAYLGHWLDGLSPGYSMRWTLSLLFAGIVIGAVNVYFLVRGRG